jgi:putative addiction module component (TIGR02574 family)
MDVTEVMEEVGNWPVEERLRLIEEVWDSLSKLPEEIVLSEAHEQDLQRRLDAYRENPKTGSPWEEVEARLRANRQ